jgi:hypothetical protein
MALCGFALLNEYLAMHRVMAEHADLQPVERLILVSTTTGNVQRAVRAEALPEVLRRSTPLPPELIVPMSWHAIARITGIPKETVRRRVDSMVKRGIRVSIPNGVRAPPGLASRKILATRS